MMYVAELAKAIRLSVLVRALRVELRAVIVVLAAMVTVNAPPKMLVEANDAPVPRDSVEVLPLWIKPKTFTNKPGEIVMMLALSVRFVFALKGLDAETTMLAVEIATLLVVALLAIAEVELR